MKSEPLNYNLRILDKDNKILDEFDYHGDSYELAHDHAEYVLNATPEADAVLWRHQGRMNWRLITKTKLN